MHQDINVSEDTCVSDEYLSLVKSFCKNSWYYADVLYTLDTHMLQVHNMLAKTSIQTRTEVLLDFTYCRSWNTYTLF